MCVCVARWGGGVCGVGVAGRGVRVCVCVRARVRVGMHVVCGQRQSVTSRQRTTLCVCVCAYVCGVGRVSVCWGGEGEAVCGVVACSGGSAWVVCVAV